MIRQIEDARLCKSSLDSALAIGNEHLHRLSGGATPTGVVVEPMRGGAYRVTVSWVSAGAGGRASGKGRMRQHRARIIPLLDQETAR